MNIKTNTCIYLNAILTIPSGLVIILANNYVLFFEEFHNRTHY